MRADFSYLNYVDYLNFITGVDIGSGLEKSYPIQKNRAYEFFYKLYKELSDKLGKYSC